MGQLWRKFHFWVINIIIHGKLSLFRLFFLLSLWLFCSLWTINLSIFLSTASLKCNWSWKVITWMRSECCAATLLHAMKQFQTLALVPCRSVSCTSCCGACAGFAGIAFIWGWELSFITQYGRNSPTLGWKIYSMILSRAKQNCCLVFSRKIEKTVKLAQSLRITNNILSDTHTSGSQLTRFCAHKQMIKDFDLMWTISCEVWR